MIEIEQITPQLTWRLRHEVLYPDTPIHQMWMDEDDEGVHFGGFADNKLIGIVSLFNRGHDYQFRKFAIAKQFQGKGFGNAILEHISAFAKTEGGKRLWCNARTSATGFYGKAGFLPTGETFSRGGFDYEVMEKQLI